MPRTRIARPAAAPPANGAPLSSVLAPDVVEPDDPVDLPPGVDGLESLMTELNGATQAKITVYRINKTGPNTYVYQCTPDAFSLDDLRDQHGGGEFRLYIMRDHEFFKNIRISVAAPKIISTAPKPNEPPEVTALREQLAARDRQIEEFRMRNISARGSILENLDLPATITALSAAIVALRPPPPPPPPENNSADRAIDMLLKGIELAKELKGDGENDTSMLGVLNNLIKSPMMAQAVASMATTPTPPEPTMPQQPRLLQPVPPTQVGAAPQPMARPMNVPRPQLPQTGIAEFDAAAPSVARYLPLLVEKARLESSDALYAELILDSVPEEIIETILVHPTQEIVQFLALLNPGVGEHTPWFTSLIEEMRAMLSFNPDAPVEGDPPNEAAAPPPV